jgi:nucleotide-binding universal stress UspA family protein
MDKGPLRVLIASDGSPSAERAIALVRGVSWPAGTEFRSITVTAPVPVLVAAALVADLPPTPPEVKRQIRSLDGRDIEIVVREGRAATRIVEEAGDWGADLIVLGSHGHGPLRSALLGSVAAEVVDHAPGAVLVARTPSADRVLLAEDGSDTAAAAGAFLARVPSLAGRELRVVSVAHIQAPLDSGIVPHLRELARHEHAETVEAARERHEQLAATRVRSLGRTSARVAQDVRVGDPAEEILKVAVEHHAELVVLGSHGRTGLQRVLLGSVARKVLLHAHCSVLIVRRPTA